jgi:hypothetical protein
MLAARAHVLANTLAFTAACCFDVGGYVSSM